jgi:acetyl-CoA carboxylase biotin carboxyl carrier protein
MNLTHEDVQEIVKLLDDSSFDELILETDRYKLTLRRAASGWTQERETARTHEAEAALKVNGAETPVALEPGVAAIYPPLVGTFYRAPKPGAPPFVEVGSLVDEDTVVAIIETMKLMNSVHAGVRGVVTEICAGNAEFVEHGHVLMKVREAA